MEPRQVVIDANVFVSALRSRSGASFQLLTLLGDDRFQINVSVPLVLQYEAAASRAATATGLTAEEISDILDYICRVANRRKVFFLWRPFLKDPKDDHVLELAVEAGCDLIVTHNMRHFAGVEQFGLRAITPKEFLEILGETA
jgi:putative PIN family toxin of toxin-antitoxin system